MKEEFLKIVETEGDYYEWIHNDNTTIKVVDDKEFDRD